MRAQVWYVAALIGLMCVGRIGFAVWGYVDPPFLLTVLGATPDLNLHGSVLLRAWAVRDVLVGWLTLVSRPNTIKPMLWACIFVDAGDVLSSILGGSAGLFSPEQVWFLVGFIGLALVPETIALLLIIKRTGWSLTAD